MKATINSDILSDVSDGAQTTGLEEGLFEFMEDGLRLQCSGGDSVVAFAAKVPQEAFDEYKLDQEVQFGLGFDKIDGFISSGNVPITLETDGTGITMSDGQFTAEMATVQPQYVEGTMDKLPRIDYEITIKDQPDFLTDFIKRVGNLFDPSTYILGAREEGVYVFSQNENNRADTFVEWEDFDDYIINWEAGNVGDDGTHNPETDEAMDVRMSMDFTKSLKSLGDEAILRFSNQGPMKWVFSADGGVKMSYFQAPRMSDEHGADIIPEEVIKGSNQESELKLS